MLNTSNTQVGFSKQNTNRASLAGLLRSAVPMLALLCVLILGAGCQSTSSIPSTPGVSATTPSKPEVIVLHEGDSVRITFPGAPNLNTVQLIRRDGRVTLPLVGEFKASGLTPSEMEKQLVELYSPQLQTKEVNVAVESSLFVVYVTGAVLRPGKIMSDRPITALEAIMEAGGFDYTKANTKSVRIIRNESGRSEQFTVNLKRVMQGQDTSTVNLKPSDIVYVPEKFTWF